VTLRDVLDDAAAAADAAGLTQETGADGVITWSIGDRPFAILEGDAASFRLDPTLAAAAGRTPDTLTATRGPEWVTFRPIELDGHAVDRARAWFAAAARRAAG
jgi:hypothetical protein